jgi:hypothetical protein
MGLQQDITFTSISINGDLRTNVHASTITEVVRLRNGKDSVKNNDKYSVQKAVTCENRHRARY